MGLHVICCLLGSSVWGGTGLATQAGTPERRHCAMLGMCCTSTKFAHQCCGSAGLAARLLKVCCIGAAHPPPHRTPWPQNPLSPGVLCRQRRPTPWPQRSLPSQLPSLPSSRPLWAPEGRAQPPRHTPRRLPSPPGRAPKLPALPRAQPLGPSSLLSQHLPCRSDMRSRQSGSGKPMGMCSLLMQRDGLAGVAAHGGRCACSVAASGAGGWYGCGLKKRRTSCRVSLSSCVLSLAPSTEVCCSMLGVNEQ